MQKHTLAYYGKIICKFTSGPLIYDLTIGDIVQAVAYMRARSQGIKYEKMKVFTYQYDKYASIIDDYFAIRGEKDISLVYYSVHKSMSETYFYWLNHQYEHDEFDHGTFEHSIHNNIIYRVEYKHIPTEDKLKVLELIDVLYNIHIILKEYIEYMQGHK